MAGRGALTVRLLGALPIVRGHGPTCNQGELLRWLAESVWLPTALLPGQQVSWQAIDDASARLTPDRSQPAAGIVRFNHRGEIVQCEAHRYFGTTGLQPWEGRFGAYRAWHGVRIRTEIEASRVLDGRRQPYARFQVQTLEYV